MGTTHPGEDRHRPVGRILLEVEAGLDVDGTRIFEVERPRVDADDDLPAAGSHSGVDADPGEEDVARRAPHANRVPDEAAVLEELSAGGGGSAAESVASLKGKSFFFDRPLQR